MSIISPIEPDRRGCRCRCLYYYYCFFSVSVFVVKVFVDGAANTVMIMRGFVTINFLKTCRFGMALACLGMASNGLGLCIMARQLAS